MTPSSAALLNRTRAVDRLSVLRFWQTAWVTVVLVVSATGPLAAQPVDSSRLIAFGPGLSAIELYDPLSTSFTLAEDAPPVPVQGPRLDAAGRGARKGLLIGALVGVAAIITGATVDMAAGCEDCTITRTQIALGVAVVTTVLGTGVGAIVGAVRVR